MSQDSEPKTLLKEKENSYFISNDESDNDANKKFEIDQNSKLKIKRKFKRHCFQKSELRH